MREYWIKCECQHIDQQINSTSTIGSEAGCDIRLSRKESVARRHARIVINDDGGWMLQAFSSDYPIFEAADNPVQQFVLEDKVAFKIGPYEFLCHIKEQDNSPPRPPDASGKRTRRPITIRPPKGVRSLQYFFQERIYRIGVLGGQESGKTCMFAALGMPRIPRGDGASCTRIHHLRTPDPEPWEMTPADLKAEEAFLAGKRLMDYGEESGGKHVPGAIESILKGNVPVPTPTNNGECRFVFKLASPSRLPGLVETIDYAGEFASPDMATEKQAQRVADIMQASDGLIILAQIPAPGGDPNEEVKAIDRIAKTFAMLKISRAVPVVLVVNKWDRMDGYDGGAAEEEKNSHESLRKFVDSENGKHLKALEDAVKNAVGVKCFTMLPVSALGTCEIVDGIERPRKSLPLESFGLEDPFVWLIDRIDAKAVADYRQEIRALSFLPWSALWSPKSRLLRQRQIELLASEVRNKQIWPAIKSAGRLLAFKRFIAKCEVGLLAVAVLLAAEYVWSSRSYMAAYQALTNQPPIMRQEDYEVSRSHTAALLPYVVSFPIRHAIASWFVSRDAVKGAVADAKKKESKYLLNTINNITLGIDARIEACNILKAEYQYIAYEHADLLKSLNQVYATMLIDRVLEGGGSIQDRIKDGEEFIKRYQDHSSRNRINEQLSHLRAATNMQARLESILRAKPAPDWKVFADLLTGVEYRQLTDDSLRKIIIDDITETLKRELLVYVNAAIDQLRDLTRIKDNEALKAIQSTTDRLKIKDEYSAIGGLFSGASELLESGILDRKLYAEASHTNRNAVKIYITEATKTNIPGFMKDRAVQYQREIYDGSLIIEKIDWIGESSERDVTIKVKDGKQYIKTDSPIDDKYVAGKTSPLNRPVNISGFSMDAIKPFEIVIEMLRHTASPAKIPGIRKHYPNPVFEVTNTNYPDQLFNRAYLDAIETKATDGNRRARIHVRIIHNHRLPEWKAGRFQSLDGKEWQP